MQVVQDVQGFSHARMRVFYLCSLEYIKIFYMRESLYPAHLAQPAQTLINTGFQQNKNCTFVQIMQICAVLFFCWG